MRVATATVVAVAVAKAFSVRRRVQKLWIGVSQHKIPPTLFRSDEAGADKSAPAPDHGTHPNDFAARRECEAEKFRHRQRTDVQASAVFGNIDDHALDPWRVGRRNQKSRLVQIDANIFAIAEVLAVSCHRIPLSRLPRRKYLSSPYRKKLIFIKGWNTALPPTGSVNYILVGARQPPHGEFDLVAWQFAPAFDPAHISGLGVAGEEIAGLGPRLVARESEGLAQIAIVRLPPAGHPVCQIARARDHVATPNTDDDRLNIALA